MRIRWYALFGTFFLLSLLIDALTFAAMATQPVVGPALVSAADVEAPIAHTYIVLGTPLVASSPVLEDVGGAVAAAAFGASYGAIGNSPDAAMDLLFSDSHGPLSALFLLSYWGAPLLLLLTLVAWVFRSRHAHLIKSVRR